MEKKFHYLLTFQYLGFRYHGWQKQPEVKTVQHMLDRTLHFILGHENFNTLGSSRTDTMVSALKTVCKITIGEDIEPETLFEKLNQNLPADIRALDVERTDKKFAVINHAKTKTYHYLFSNEDKTWPFSAPYMVNISDELDIDLMKVGAKFFEGTHNFKAYCYRPSEGKIFERHVEFSEISDNTLLSANFFPPNTYMYTVKGEGFMRHQIRLMMGALLKLGMGQISLDELKDSLKPEAEPIGFVAPASGLILGDLNFKN